MGSHNADLLRHGALRDCTTPCPEPLGGHVVPTPTPNPLGAMLVKTERKKVTMKLKPLLSIGLLVAAAFISPVQAAAPTQVTGEVLEVKEVAVYTYLRLKTATGETWAAVVKAPVAIGAKVTLDNVMVMENFESKELKKTFPSILFGSLANNAGTGAAPAADPHAGMPKMSADPHAGKAMAPAEMADAKVAKATGPNAYTVAEIIGKADELKEKPVRVQGKVVKYNAGIMDKNWIHLRDGSGSAADGNNDILVTTDANAKLGDVVTVSGVVHTNNDFGSGYTYKILIEEATLKP